MLRAGDIQFFYQVAQAPIEQLYVWYTVCVCVCEERVGVCIWQMDSSKALSKSSLPLTTFLISVLYVVMADNIQLHPRSSDGCKRGIYSSPLS